MTCFPRSATRPWLGAALFGLAALLAPLLAGTDAHAAGRAASAPLKPVTAVEGITEYRLANGLQVLLAPDDAKPTVTVNMTYRVGSRHESYGETGMAHLLEHLIFKGTPTTRNALAEFSKRGLRANGTTWLDRTNYFASFAYDEANLRWYLSWQADAMVNSFIARRDLDTEMTVVRNEMESGENSASRILFEKTLASMYQWHNYGKTTIGARADVENVDIGRLQAFYRTYYQPDNATLIVSGRFEPAKVMGWIRRSFERIPRPQRKLPVLHTIDPVQDGERSVTLRRVGGSPLMFAAYHVPPGAHPDYAAVEMLGLVAADAPAGRLHRALVGKQLAADVFAFAQGLADPGFAIFGAQLAPGQDADAAREALLDVLESFEREPVSDEELKRAQARWLKDWELNFADPERIGVSLSDSVSQGDWRLFFLLRDRVRALTAADVQRAATRYLLRANRTLAQYVPTEAPQRAPAPQRVDVAAQLADFKPQAQLAKAEAFEATPANIEARTRRASLPVGLRTALLAKGTRGQTVEALLTLHLGTEQSLRGQATAGEMLAALLDKGARSVTRQQVQDRLDALQAELSFSGDAESVTARITTRRDNLPAVIELAGTLLREPALEASDLEEVRRQWLAGLASQRKEPGAVASLALNRHGSPYAAGDVRYVSTFEESEADVKAVTLEQVRAFHAGHYGASRAEFAAVGDMDVAAVRLALEKAFGDWRSPVVPERVPRLPLSPEPVRLSAITPDKQNATLLAVQHLPLNDLHADYPALTVANWMLGGDSDSRLWSRIREKEGLSYDVRSYVRWNNIEADSAWTASAIFAPSNRARVEAALREEIERALKEGFTAEELRSAKSSLLNYRRLGRAQDGGLARALAGNLYLDRTMALSQQVDEAIAALTLEQANDALRRYLKPDRFVWSLAGDFKD